MLKRDLVHYMSDVSPAFRTPPLLNANAFALSERLKVPKQFLTRLRRHPPEIFFTSSRGKAAHIWPDITLDLVYVQTMPMTSLI